MKWFATAAVLAAALARTTYAGSPPFSVSVETSWAAPPLILEILEVVYDEDPKSYFPLLRLLTKHTLALGPNPTAERVLEVTLNLLDSHKLLKDASSKSTLNLALALHTAAPRITAAYGAYDASKAQELGTAECESWVEYRGKGYCDADALRKDIERTIESTDKVVVPKAQSQPFDRVSHATFGEGPTAVLYYSPSEGALPLVEYLEEHVKAFPTFQYAVRYRPTTAGDEDSETVKRTPLTGYGVEMALKKTDYLVVDDRMTGGSSGQTTFQASEDSSDPFSSVLGSDPWAETATPLSEQEIPTLGLKAVALVQESQDPLNAFVQLSQDLPKYAASIARNVEVPENITTTANRLAVRSPFGPAFIINGRPIKEVDLNAFGLLKAIRRERHIMDSLLSQGLEPEQAMQLITDPEIGAAQTERDPVEGLVDASDRIEGGGIIGWLNDIEEDSQYSRWPSSIQGYLRPLYPGQLHMIRRNTWNVVLVLDLSTSHGIEAVASTANQIISRTVPVRIGLVPLFDDKDGISAKAAKLITYISNELGGLQVRQFANLVMAFNPNPPGASYTVSEDSLRAAYERIVTEGLSYDELIDSPGATAWLDKTLDYVRRVGATKAASEYGSVFINGKWTAYSGQWTQVLQNTLTQQLNFLQETLSSGHSVDADAISTFFYDQPTTSMKRNVHVVPDEEFEVKSFNLLDVFADEANILNSDFMYPTNDDKSGTPLTTWIVGDLDSHDGIGMVRNVVEHLQGDEASSRLGFIHVPTQETPAGQKYRLSTLIFQLIQSDALSKIKPDEFLAILDEISSKGNLVDVGQITADSESDSESSSGTPPPLNSFSYAGWTVSDANKAPDFWRIGNVVADRLKLRSTAPHVLINGRLVGPVKPEEFTPLDFDSLEVYELRKRVHPVINLLQTFWKDPAALGRDTLAKTVAIVSSAIATAYSPEGVEGIFANPPGPRSRFYQQMDDGEMSFTVGNLATARIQVALVVDPVSETAQKWSALAKLLSELSEVAVSVYFDPNIIAKEFKVKRFYRSALRSSLMFDVDGEEVAPVVTFNDMPSTPIFTLAMHTPNSWIVRPKESPLDLDNLLLGRLNEPTHVLFDLKKLVIDGHARDENSAPPRGLQLHLKKGETVVSDTQVMANLGYFQFKASPGVYSLAIRPGRGQEVYELESVGTTGWESEPVNVTGTTLTVDAFDSKIIFPVFRHKAGMEMADVLADSAGEQSLVSSVFSRVKSIVGLKDTSPASRHADINIFTVASGLLYERFASIMILSVMKHTKSTVKFWFIENFLSPTFINFLPHLAKEYGFDYELVTYKWPDWLRAQTEKQRIIWAYKILFLDVLFPMDLDKVIFVDADQIVRVDMNELNEVDLEGKVYGYPPMGDDREEMEGFRFWKTGYWKKELRGRPYHISALYVVDLKRFRQLATGDRLRGQYQALSADPNSLANLDQDLPNSMQTQIPIHTLDQDWLWCQTWCSDESLATAKTIDLCQNPLTKEPKLVRARQIPEWDTYDREIARFAATLDNNGALAANVDDLAEGPGSIGGGQKDKPLESPEPVVTPEEEAEQKHDEL